MAKDIDIGHRIRMLGIYGGSAFISLLGFGFAGYGIVSAFSKKSVEKDPVVNTYQTNGNDFLKQSAADTVVLKLDTPKP